MNAIIVIGVLCGAAGVALMFWKKKESRQVDSLPRFHIDVLSIRELRLWFSANANESLDAEPFLIRRPILPTGELKFVQGFLAGNGETLLVGREIVCREVSSDLNSLIDGEEMVLFK